MRIVDGSPGVVVMDRWMKPIGTMKEARIELGKSTMVDVEGPDGKVATYRAVSYGLHPLFIVAERGVCIGVDGGLPPTMVVEYFDVLCSVQNIKLTTDEGSVLYDGDNIYDAWKSFVVNFVAGSIGTNKVTIRLDGKIVLVRHFARLRFKYDDERYRYTLYSLGLEERL